MSLTYGTTRTTLQELARSHLVAGSTAAGSRVYVGRIESIQPGADLPLLMVRVSQEVDALQVAGQSGLACPAFERTFTLDVVAVVTGASDAATDTALGVLVEQVRTELIGSTTWLDDAGGTGSAQVASCATTYLVGDSDADAALASAIVSLTVVVDGVQYGGG